MAHTQQGPRQGDRAWSSGIIGLRCRCYSSAFKGFKALLSEPCHRLLHSAYPAEALTQVSWHEALHSQGSKS